MANLGTTGKSGECPSPQVWGLICLGALSDDQAEVYLAHASTCPECSALLRQASDVLSVQTSLDEEVAVSKSASSGPIWQEQMAQTVLDSVSSDKSESGSVKTSRWNWRILR